MLKSLLLLGLLVGGMSQLHAVDWAQVERDWQQKADDVGRNVRSEPYRIATADPEIYRGTVPELGVCVHGIDDAVAAALAQAGIRSVRQTVYWYQVEKTEVPGVYDPAEMQRLDALMDFYAAHDLEPLILVHGNAPGVTPARPEEAYQRFATFIAMLAERYPQVKYWELWNEMDVGFTDLFGGYDPEVSLLEGGKRYAAMLQVAYPAIKAANPDAVVVSGGMAHFNDFARGIYEGGGKDYFDVMNVHSYGIPVKYQFLESALSLQALMREFGDGDKPIWNTEFGAGAEGLTSAWGVPETDTVATFDQLQLEQLRTCIELNQANRLYQKIFLYAYSCGLEGDEALRAALRAKTGDYDLDDLGYTLTRKDGSFRPVFDWIIATQPNRERFAH